MNWTECHRLVASALQDYRQKGGDLVGLLADALYCTGVSFPVAQTNEELRDIDPFTFLASFNRQMPEISRQRLASVLCANLGVCSDKRIDFAGAPVLPLHKLRFFSDRHSQQAEIESLWRLLALLLVLDSNDDGFNTGLSEAIRHTVKEYTALNAVGREKLQWAFCWVCPTHHQQLIKMLSSESYPTKKFIKAQENAINPRPPTANKHAFNTILTEYVLNGKQSDGKQFGNQQLGKWLSVKRFTEFFDIDAADFIGMLRIALGDKNSLLENTSNFYPYSEIIRLAELEQKSVRDAFRELFDESINLPARVLHFCNAITVLHESYRDRFTRQQIKPCAHANYYVASIYLFMYDPHRYFLYSPTRAQRLSAAVSYGEVFRPTDADAVETYAEMCEQLIACLSEHPQIIEIAKEPKEVQSGFADPNNHLLLDDIIVTSFDI
jgi:hypothetical protein